jgi:hypothetical protein
MLYLSLAGNIHRDYYLSVRTLVTSKAARFQCLRSTDESENES